MDAISIIKYGVYGTKILANKLLHSNTNEQLLDPLSCIIRLSLLSFKEKGTKIRIANNKIYFQAPTIMQGPTRWTYGDNRSDLHFLCYPIEKAILTYNPNENQDVKNIFIFAIKGLNKLKESYREKNVKVGDSNLVCDSISHYIMLIENKLGENKNINDTKNENVNNNVNDNVWKLKEIEIVNNLLLLALTKKKNNDEYTYLINSIESLLEDKDKIMKELLRKLSQV